MTQRESSIPSKKGEPIPRLDALAKVMGQTLYAGDIYLPESLVGWVVTSPIAHGIVRGMELSKAKGLPGVHAILTAQDIPGINRLMYMMEDQEYIVTEHVRTIADCICVIAADDEQIAQKAEELIRFDIEPLPIVRTPDEALSDQAPLLHTKGNIAKHVHIEKGNIEKGFEQADVVLEDLYKTQPIEHAYLEPESAIAYVDGDDILHVLVGCHSVHQEKVNLSHALGIPENQIHVSMPAMGGSFGGKDDHLISVYTALLAMKTGRPVKMVWSRRQSFKLSFKRHATSTKLKVGATKEGQLTAFQAHIVYDTGAYAHWGPSVLSFAACQATGPYKIPNAVVDAYAVYTNNIRAGAMRGWGTPQVAFAWESHMDRLAYALDMHPLEFRYLNAQDDESDSLTGGPLPVSVGLKDTILKAAELCGVEMYAPNRLGKMEG
jgi:CO/xanthine dehydrogenase Mo-binding subunit